MTRNAIKVKLFNILARKILLWSWIKQLLTYFELLDSCAQMFRWKRGLFSCRRSSVLLSFDLSYSGFFGLPCESLLSVTDSLAFLSAVLRHSLASEISPYLFCVTDLLVNFIVATNMLQSSTVIWLIFWNYNFAAIIMDTSPFKCHISYLLRIALRLLSVKDASW